MSSNGVWIASQTGGNPTLFNQQTGALTTLPTTPGVSNLQVYAVNNQGAAAAGGTNQNGESRSFYWDGASFTPLGRVSAGKINNLGQVVGQTQGTVFLTAYVWSPTAGFTYLGPIYTYIAEAINDTGSAACLYNPPPFTVTTLGVCNTSTGVQTLLPHSIYGVRAMNDAGWIIGYSMNGSWVYIPGQGMIGLDFLATDINNQGTIVGERRPGFNVATPIVWTLAGGARELANGGLAYVSPTAIADDGSIVGWAPFGNLAPASVPEPSTLAMVLMGSIAALLSRRKPRN